MSGWNRLFVIVAVCWALVAPFLLMAEANKPIEQTQSMCADVAYNLYGSSSSSHLDMARYDAEVKKCIDTYVRHVVSIQKLLSAMAGQGERELGLVVWGFILIPLAVLWIVGGGLARIVFWVAAGFGR